MRATPILLTLAALLLLLAAPATATDVTVYDPGLVERDVNVDDSDNDGWEETDGSVVGGSPCGCACPVAYGGAHLEAAGSEADVVVGTVILPFCGVGAWWDVDPTDPDPFAPVVVDPATACWFFPLDGNHNCVPDSVEFSIQWP